MTVSCLGKIKICRLGSYILAIYLPAVLYVLHNIVGWSIASTYNLGGIFTLGRTYWLYIDLPTVLCY